MSDRWFLLQSGPGDPAWNMALDEALLESSPGLGSPVLRFYSWIQPAATFGYSQKFSDLEKATHLRPLIRRTTGGGLVPHDADWTYSVVCPPDHGWYHLKAEESYQRLHEWLQRAFKAIQVETTLSPCCQKEVPSQCFRGAEKHDLLWHGRKIAGAAQRRAKFGLLIQGSVQPPPTRLKRGDWEQAMCAVAGERWSMQWVDKEVDAALHQRAGQLAAEKFSQPAFNQKR